MQWIIQVEVFSEDLAHCLGLESRSSCGFDEYEVDNVEEVLEGLVESAGDIIGEEDELFK